MAGQATTSSMGGADADTLKGGLGDDSFFVDATNDSVVELAGAGMDTVFSKAATYALAANVENLTLLAGATTGVGNAGANTIVGNAAANTLTGGDGNDTLDGGAAVDTLVGGKGNDSYSVDNAAEVVVELANEGIDTVYSKAASFTLGANVENLVLSTGAVSGTGNAGANVITGNAGDNTITGRAGNDVLKGLAGNDMFV